MQVIEAETASVSDLARECVYRFFAMVLASPYEPNWPFVLNPDDQRLVLEAAVLLREEADFRPEFLSFGECSPDNLDLAALLIELNRPLVQIRAEYDRVFGLVIPKECPPYETEYHPSSQAFQRSQQLADIAGFYNAFGLEPSNANPERPDHITLEFEFMAFLLTKKRLATATEELGDEAAERLHVCEQAEHSFVKDHLAWWVPAFATGLHRKAGGGLYQAIAGALAALIPAERHRLNLPSPFQKVQPELIEYPEEDAGCAACSLRT
jgi:TorA maturation chaperone TorD